MTNAPPTGIVLMLNAKEAGLVWAVLSELARTDEDAAVQLCASQICRRLGHRTGELKPTSNREHIDTERKLVIAEQTIQSLRDEIARREERL